MLKKQSFNKEKALEALCSNRSQGISDQVTYEQLIQQYYGDDYVANIIYYELPENKLKEHKNIIRCLYYMLYLAFLVIVFKLFDVYGLISGSIEFENVLSNKFDTAMIPIIHMFSYFFTFLLCCNVLFLLHARIKKNISNIIQYLITSMVFVFIATAYTFDLSHSFDIFTFVFLILVPLLIFLGSIKIRSILFNVSFRGSLKKDIEGRYCFPYRGLE